MDGFIILDFIARLPRWRSGKESTCKCKRPRRHGFDPWFRKIPRRRKWQPTPVFSWKIPRTVEPGGLYNSWGHKSWTRLRRLTQEPSSGLCVCSVSKSCQTLCDPMDYSPPGSSVHGIFQARILEWVAVSFSRGSS